MHDKKILFIDHYDSFSNNLIAFFEERSFVVEKIQSEDLNTQSVLKYIEDYTLVIFSPGPGQPTDYPNSLELYKNLPQAKPFLGVCLGHQMLLYSYNIPVTQISHKPVHGRQISFNQTIHTKIGSILLAGTAVLYNSLGASCKERQFHANFISHGDENGINLIAEHKIFPHWGVQFHPESFASTIGQKFLEALIKSLD